MSIVRRNLMDQEGYSPYCGRDGKCTGVWPRTIFNGKQFRCPACGWESKFDDKFILKYKAKWSIK